ncbi:tRNA dimethylallyltransferase [Pedobacter sp. CAN_A7]|uniref:tRNA (adenosine(37)-N6)-dimethylallyltransferase MiaA n=1 Tax=Pedobacter sp. CAN_A7 TaxID=2787722 RepID=UPI0018CB81B2
MKEPFIIILGPTASGKTRLAVAIAHALHGEIISADSRQVFKGMDIGTGKDLNEYMIDGQQVPYHLIDHKKAGSRYQVDAFKDDFYEAYVDIKKRAKLPILCGGTGMYIHSLLQNHHYTAIPVNLPLRDALLLKTKADLEDQLLTFPIACREHADLSTSKRLIRAIEIADYLTHHTLIPRERPTLEPHIIGLTSSVETRRNRIYERLKYRLKEGLIEEVQRLIKQGVTAEMLVFYGLEYKFVVSYLQQEISFDQLQERLYTAICQYAKRQMTFFRKMEKDGVQIHWYAVDQEDDLAAKLIKELKMQVNLK